MAIEIKELIIRLVVNKSNSEKENPSGFLIDRQAVKNQIRKEVKRQLKSRIER